MRGRSSCTRRYGKTPSGGTKLTPHDTHGSLSVVSYVGDGAADELWRLDCVCGKAKILPSATVLSGNVVDCGTCEAAHERVSNANLAALIARTRPPREGIGGTDTPQRVCVAWEPFQP